MLAAPLRVDDTPKKVLVLGASGMLGHALMYELSGQANLDVRGAVRSDDTVPSPMRRAFGGAIVTGLDVLDGDQRRGLLSEMRPDVVINAVGVIKQDPKLTDPINTVRVNALLPHKLARDCTQRGARLIHLSTDCVFSGRTGSYTELNVPDPVDFYGRSKLLGEIGAPHVTLRTSIIGHELKRHGSLVDWFLSQPPSTPVRGFTRAIYTGVTTVELARLLSEVVISNESLEGLFHVASTPISKYDLLSVVAQVYGWEGVLEREDDFVCDRSMLAEVLAARTGYRPPEWPEMIFAMKAARECWAERDAAITEDRM